jgi:hypothetical protein
VQRAYQAESTQAGASAGAGAGAAGEGGKDDVLDAEFEEVKDQKSKPN